MNFTFTDEQLQFRDSVAALLGKALSPDTIRQRWDTGSGRDDALLSQLVDMGLTGMLVPETAGGLGLGEVDLVLIVEECGRAALPEPLVETTLVVTPMLSALAATSTRCAELLPGLVDGSVNVAVGHWINPYVNYGHLADWFLLPNGDEVHLVEAAAVSLQAQSSVDPSRRLAKLEWKPVEASRVADGVDGAELWRATLNRGALGSAAQMLGLAQAMVDRAVRYGSEREQFGRAIGSNQAVKHLLADCAAKIEFARAPVYRAAYTSSVDPARADLAVSHAKVAAGQAALLAARHAIQVHGAMGYTWECDLHIWMKRAWALDKEWGDAGFHKNRVHQWLLHPRALLGAENTFGRPVAEHYHA